MGLKALDDSLVPLGPRLGEKVDRQRLSVRDGERQMAEADDRTREILARTESMPPEQFLKMHGALRGLR